VTIKDIRAVLSAYLIAAGTAGHTEKEIYARFRHLPKEDVITELHVMWELEMVQRFTLDPKRVVWRATDKLNV
jgi:uncharacterized protein (DUF433 family)